MLDNLNSGQIDAANSIIINDVSKVYTKVKSSLSDKNRTWRVMIDALLNVNHRKTQVENFIALQSTSFKIKKGDAVGIIGLNGSGKSTLLQIIAGTLKPTTGEVKAEGKIGAMLELGSGFNPDFTGKENIYLNAKILGLKQNEIDKRYDAITTFSGIGDFVNQPVRTYSSGMVVRLAFAVVAHIEPDILIIDEALAVGDARFQSKCFSFLESFKEKGKTLLFVSHDLNSIARLCSKAVLLDKGKLLLTGTPKEVINEYSKIISEGIQQKNINFDKINQNELLQKDHKETASSGEFNYGGKKAEITNLQILNDQNFESNIITSGDDFTILFNVTCKSEVEEPIYAVTIRDPKGQQVYGHNTYFSKLPTPPLQCKDNIKVEFKLKANLGAGKYLISFGLTQFQNNDLVVIHRRYDALEFEILNSDGSFGISNCMATISIENQSN